MPWEDFCSHRRLVFDRALRRESSKEEDMSEEREKVRGAAEEGEDVEGHGHHPTRNDEGGNAGERGGHHPTAHDEDDDVEGHVVRPT